MINKKNMKFIIIGILVILALVAISMIVFHPPISGDIKSEKDVQSTVKNMTNDIKDLGNTLNELDNILK